MIRKKSFLLLPLVTMLVFAFTPQMQANDDKLRDTYGKCAKKIKNVGVRCMYSMDVHADRCAKRVREAVNNGQFDRAVTIAKTCEQQLVSAAQDCVAKINMLRKRCGKLLEGSIWEKQLHKNADRIIQLVISERDVAIKSVYEMLGK